MALYITSIRTFAGMLCLHMIIQQTFSFETSITSGTFVSLIIQMCSAFMGHQIRSLRKTGITNVADVRPLKTRNISVFRLNGQTLTPSVYLARMGSFVVLYFSSPSECFVAYTTNEWLSRESYLKSQMQ